MIEFFFNLFAMDFMPHIHCYLEKPEVLWLHVGSDALIVLAYYSIPVGLVYLVHKRRDLGFSWMFWLFAAFITACGTTHLLDIWTTWNATYRFEGLVKLFTALVSVTTAVALWPTIPRILALPSPRQLSEVNALLQAEILKRQQAEADLQAANVLLEERVRLRTAELERAHADNLRLASRRETGFKVRQVIWAMEKTEDMRLVVRSFGQCLNEWQLPFYACAINVLDSDDSVSAVHFFGMTADGKERRSTSPIGADSPIHHFIGNKTPVYRPDLEADDPYGEKEPIQKGYKKPIRAVLDVPFSHGTISLCSLTPHAYSQEDLELLQELLADFEESFRRVLDLHQLERQNKELERSNSELDQFAYIASHDLKAPLRGIQNLAEWIADDAGGVLSEKSRGHLDLLHGRVLRLNRLLDDLLQYARVGRQQSQPEAVDSRALVEEVVDLLDPPDAFDIRIGADMPRFETVAAALELVFRNLIGNVLKHHDRDSGQITIEADSGARYLEFGVCDDGPGIPAEEHQQIFDLFRKLKSADEVEGSGMGLAIVKKTVEYYGGMVTVESEAGRRGTCFRFTWPRVIKG